VLQVSGRPGEPGGAIGRHMENRGRAISWAVAAVGRRPMPARQVVYNLNQFRRFPPHKSGCVWNCAEWPHL